MDLEFKSRRARVNTLILIGFLRACSQLVLSAALTGQTKLFGANFFTAQYLQKCDRVTSQRGQQ